jgi:hypothetical protein
MKPKIKQPKIQQKPKNKQALAITATWTMMFAALFALNVWQFSPEGIMIMLCVYFPLQFGIGFIVSLFATWSYHNYGRALDMFFSWCSSIRNRMTRIKPEIKCEDGDEEACTKIAEWACYATWWWKREYPSHPIEYYCTNCMMLNLEGVHTGGGPTAESYDKLIPLRRYAKVIRIKPPEFDELLRKDIKEKREGKNP